MTFGEKLKKARMEAGYTQDELADIIAVSRAAIAKWESDRGMPDVTNLKSIAASLNTSVDYLLDDGTSLDLSITKKAISFNEFIKGDKNLTRLKKIEIKEKIIREEYPNADITRLTVTKIKNTKAENTVDGAVGLIGLLFGGIPLFGGQQTAKMLNIVDQQYYLVNDANRQYFVLMTDEQMMCRALAERITKSKFEIGDKQFLVAGKVE